MTIRTLMTVFLVALNTVFSSAALDYLGDSDLVAWWTFEAGDGETARDRTDNNNNGTVLGGRELLAVHRVELLANARRRQQPSHQLRYKYES